MIRTKLKIPPKYKDQKCISAYLIRRFQKIKRNKENNDTNELISKN